MKKLALCLLTCFAVAQLHAAELAWTTDLPKAQARAKAEKKLVMLDFTGSDWCGWCIKLNKEVFNTTDFIAYASKNIVPVEVDFPNKKKQSADSSPTPAKTSFRWKSISRTRKNKAPN
jgi:protein disulfide-isomerase